MSDERCSVAGGVPGSGPAWRSSLRSRSRRLGTPLFVGAVLLLLTNDHVLKGQAPEWFTGKASDVAGVAMVGIVTSVLLGRRWGVVVTAVMWIGLKTVPGVAERFTPVLGGQTVAGREVDDGQLPRPS